MYRVDSAYVGYVSVVISIITVGYLVLNTRRTVQREAIDDIRDELRRCEQKLKEALDDVRRLNHEVDRLTRIVMRNYRDGDDQNKWRGKGDDNNC